MFKYLPCVFAVEDEYQITILTDNECMVKVKVGDEIYYDDSNGILKSKEEVHKISIPMDELNNSKKYTVIVEDIIERKPYFTDYGETTETTFEFYPVPEKNARAYMIADAHNLVDAPVRALDTFGNIDFLIFNGDVLEHSGEIENFYNIYKLAEIITKGNIPCVFSRGNHDLRGIFAEKLADYMPGYNGKSYFTFSVGNIWGIILDCGEDKDDMHEEYGHTICCHSFRMKETKFIEEVIKNGEYNNDKYKYKLIVAHKPFTVKDNPPFDIEEDTYAYWSKILRENVKADVMLTGHLHDAYFDNNESQIHPCPLVVGSLIEKRGDYFAGTGIEFNDDEIVISFTDSNGKTLEVNKVKLNG